MAASGWSFLSRPGVPGAGPPRGRGRRAAGADHLDLRRDELAERTANWRVVEERPDLTQRYLECLSFPVRGPWFAYLTGGDSRYIDFERSTPVAAFGLGEDGRVIDLTPYLSFENVIPWEVPPGNWRLVVHSRETR